MIYGFYFRFYKLIHVKWLSILLSYLARFLFFLRFLGQKIWLKPETVNISEEDALAILRRTSPEPETKPDYSMTLCDPDLDLSIIVPVYNHSDILARCIEGLIKQKTKFRYELILVDDGSTDGAGKLIEQYRDLDPVRIIHRLNGGIAAARDTGIVVAHGRYIMFADCDDTVEDTLVEELMSAAERENSDIAMCAHDLIKCSNGDVTDVIPNIYPEKNLLGYKNGDEIMNYAGLPWAKVYKRQLFENVRFFPGYWYEDTIVQSLLFIQCGKFTYIPKVLYHYYWYDSNFSHVQEGSCVKSKAVDRYWLLKAITCQYERMGLPRDAVFYTMLLKHVSAYYYKTIADLPEEVVKAMFIAGRELLLRYKPKEPVRLPYMLRLTEKAVLEENIALWKLCSVNQ